MTAPNFRKALGFSLAVITANLIWNDLSSQLVGRTSVLFISAFFLGCVIDARESAAWVVAELAVATVDHSDIRGSKPHNRDPSGAASD
jgi:hypothetical protein